jgi:peroxiredoxin/uncharacterized membrane protein YphA (DoxX/SURF4 family)
MVLLVRIVLTLVFGVAGVSKLLDLSGSRQAMRGFGVPERFARLAGTLLPVAEIVIAVALLFAETAWAGALAALGLLMLFVLGIVVNLARGRTPDCHCFGQLHSAPIGRTTLLRNALLALLAAFVVVQGQQGAESGIVEWLAAPNAAATVGLVIAVIAVAVAAAEGWFLLNLLQQQGRLLVRLEALETLLGMEGQAPQSPAALPPGTPAPGFDLVDLEGARHTLESFTAHAAPVLLVFSDPGCGPCNALMPQMARWQRDYAEQFTVVIVSHGSVEANRRKSSEFGLTNVLLQHDHEVAEAYGCLVTPGAVLLYEGKIATPVALGSAEIESLVAEVTGSRNARRNGNHHPPQLLAKPLTIGDAAPVFSLPDLNGTLVHSADFLPGKETLLLFWNPDCGYCNRMLSDLKQWEAAAPGHAPRILIVSSGAAEANRKLELQSTVVLDRDFAVGHEYGVRGTPSALLIDADAKIASEVAVGAPAILALARRDPLSQS